MDNGGANNHEHHSSTHNFHSGYDHNQTTANNLSNDHQESFDDYQKSTDDGWTLGGCWPESSSV